MKILVPEANILNHSLTISKRVNELINDLACAEFSKLKTPYVTSSKDSSIKLSRGIIGNQEEGFVETCDVKKVSIYVVPTQSINNYINDYEGAVLAKTDAHYEAIYVAHIEGDEDGNSYQCTEKLFLENSSQELSRDNRTWLINELLYDYLFTHKQITELINIEAMQVIVCADIQLETTTITVFSLNYKSYSVPL